MFVTYASLIAKKSHPKGDESPTRLDQILEWAGNELYDGLIIFDESHKAKNLIPENGITTKTGLKVMDLQKKLPNARVVYASATGASEPRNLAYMSRLGLWGEGALFLNFETFIKFVEKNDSLVVHELVALDLKWQGIFLARQLSFQGCSFEIIEIEIDPENKKVYDKSVELVKILFIFFRIISKIFL